MNRRMKSKRTKRAVIGVVVGGVLALGLGAAAHAAGGRSGPFTYTADPGENISSNVAAICRADNAVSEITRQTPYPMARP